MAASRWKKLWRPIWNRLPPKIRRGSLSNPLLAGVLLLAFFATLVLLLTPALPHAQLRLEANQVARRDYRATHTFFYEAPDPEADSRAREAVRSVPRVYRYDGTVRERLFHEILPQVFGTMRELSESRRQVLEALRERHEAELAARLGRGAMIFGIPDDSPSDEIRALRAAHARETAEALRLHEDDIAIARARAIEHLGPEVPPETLDALMEIGFPDELRRMAESLLADALQDLIVADRAELHSEIERGIDVIRPDGQPPQHVVDITEDFLDLHKARARAQMLANLRFRERRAPDYFNDDRVRRAFVDLVGGLVVPTARYDPEATSAAHEKARQAVYARTQKHVVQADQVIVRKGQVITDVHLALLRAMQGWETEVDRFRTTAGMALAVLLLLGLTYVFGLRHLKSRARQGRDLVFVCVVLVVHVGLIRLSMAVSDAVIEAWGGLPLSALYFAMPFAMGAMFIRLFVTPRAAVLYSVVFAMLTGLLIDRVGVTPFTGSAALYIAALVLLGGLAGAARMSAIRNRADILKAGLAVGGFNVLMASSFWFLDSAPLSLATLATVLGAGLGGLISAALVGALTPVFEWAFGYTTDIKLLELGSLNQPLLKRLMLESPGTYHHSFLVGNLVESAAESIEANPLLARVAALYHDLGKLKNPLYFGENQHRGANRHDRLQPTMSALVIRTHVKDSVRMAQENRLGREITGIIEQHHGTTLIGFFYHKACQAVGESGPKPPESDFRYPGPKPQSREAALVLIADAAEAAVRSIPEKTPSRIHGMVHRIILNKFNDGQLDDCGLTLRDLHRIEEIFTTVLQGIHHARPAYPERQRPATQPRLQAVASPR